MVRKKSFGGKECCVYLWYGGGVGVREREVRGVDICSKWVRGSVWVREVCVGVGVGKSGSKVDWLVGKGNLWGGLMRRRSRIWWLGRERKGEWEIRRWGGFWGVDVVVVRWDEE